MHYLQCYCTYTCGFGPTSFSWDWDSTELNFHLYWFKYAGAYWWCCCSRIGCLQGENDHIVPTRFGKILSGGGYQVIVLQCTFFLSNKHSCKLLHLLSHLGALPDHCPFAMHTRMGFPSSRKGDSHEWVATEPKCVPALKLMSPFFGGVRRLQLIPYDTKTYTWHGKQS